jgi:signal transduction histidine kinase
MTRVVTVGGRAYGLAMGGLALLFIVLLGSAAWLGYLLLGWSARLRQLEAALARDSGDLPALASTGQRDLDRIIAAINGAGTRLADARQRAEQLARQVAESERLAALGRMSAGVAHEIRNPIAAMRLKAENALVAGVNSERKDGALRMVLEQIGRLDALLRNLLSTVRQGPPDLTPVDIQAFLAGRAELFREQAERQGLTIDTGAKVEDGAFDRDRIAQALDNLILNAIQNTPRGGKIHLVAERTGDRLVLSIADTGQGVPEAMRDHLFEPFFSSRADGTGLGLAIVREIAESHGGSVGAVHRSDGTTFYMELPWRLS